MPVDDAFSRADLARLYDALNPAGADSEFYLRLATQPCSIVDVGCGTGLLTLLYAQGGHDVTGVEPAEGMLAMARQNDVTALVHWLAATGADFISDNRFDLAVMTGHVFQVFLNDAATLAVLKNIRSHLKPGGRLAFDSRNPLARAFDGWTAEKTLRHIELGGSGTVCVHHQLLAVDGEQVTFETVFDFIDAGRLETSRSTLRFPSQDTIAALLAQAGFDGIDWIGYWDGSAFAPESREIIVVAHKAR
ncbi:class I SAM-dependent methyltransferase [Neorhizobium sp. JUb45]|uniref:class I SAM-dependent methyltransferase n=1 Tax=unclassified Neorhizobium TaxID=2629175 RepID=UPI00104EDF94|nr:class I SAM-dependent methyltransferase [Neorhizobium sp. JUb45]TCR02007.1 ubiquinone/menaquinone biosynthesis C-methylase UbiE [Neorhizobium sp. JUb45]